MVRIQIVNQVMLLFLITPSCMVVPNKELVNTLFLFDFSLLSNSQVSHNNMAMDMEINTPRGQSTNLSTTNSKTISVYLNAFSTAYTE